MQQGKNDVGQLGIGSSTTSKTIPTAVTAVSTTWASVSVTWPGRSCALTTAGYAYCWGANNQQANGYPMTGSMRTPTAVYSSVTYSSISAGSDITCVIPGTPGSSVSPKPPAPPAPPAIPLQNSVCWVRRRGLPRGRAPNSCRPTLCVTTDTPRLLPGEKHQSTVWQRLGDHVSFNQPATPRDAALEQYLHV